MCTKKSSEPSEKNTKTRCCDGMAEMMKDCCPDGKMGSDCLAKMKKMWDRFESNDKKRS